jgi:hypothetical protein
VAGLVVLAAAAVASLLLNSAAPLAGYIMAVLALTAWRSRDGAHLALYRRIRPLAVAQSVVLLACVAGTVALLLSLQNPLLNFSWYAVLLEHVSASPSDGIPAGGAANVLLEPLSYRWLAVPFVGLLLFLLPRLALTEERIFRSGTRTWRQGIYRSLIFGLAHLPMGIPLGAALGLSIGGLWFTRQYFRGGVQLAAVSHLTYNLVALCIISVLVFVPLP